MLSSVSLRLRRENRKTARRRARALKASHVAGKALGTKVSQLLAKDGSNLRQFRCKFSRITTNLCASNGVHTARQAIPYSSLCNSYWVQWLIRTQPRSRLCNSLLIPLSLPLPLPLPLPLSLSLLLPVSLPLPLCLPLPLPLPLDQF